MDIGMQQGLHFNHCWAVGNSAQLGIEDLLEYHDEVFNPETSSKSKTGESDHSGRKQMESKGSFEQRSNRTHADTPSIREVLCQRVQRGLALPCKKYRDWMQNTFSLSKKLKNTQAIPY